MLCNAETTLAFLILLEIVVGREHITAYHISVIYRFYIQQFLCEVV